MSKQQTKAFNIRLKKSDAEKLQAFADALYLGSGTLVKTWLAEHAMMSAPMDREPLPSSTEEHEQIQLRLPLSLVEKLGSHEKTQGRANPFLERIHWVILRRLQILDRASTPLLLPSQVAA